MPDASERKRREREAKIARGLVRREMWVFPSIWDKVRAYADRKNKAEDKRLNAEAEKERK